MRWPILAIARGMPIQVHSWEELHEIIGRDGNHRSGGIFAQSLPHQTSEKPDAYAYVMPKK